MNSVYIPYNAINNHFVDFYRVGNADLTIIFVRNAFALSPVEYFKAFFFSLVYKLKEEINQK